VPQRIGAVGQDANLEDGIGRGGHRLHEGHSRLGGFGRQNENAVVAPRRRQQETHFPFRAKHAFARHTANVARSDGHPFGGEVRAQGGQDDEASGRRNVRCAADDTLLVAGAAIDRYQVQPRSIGVRLDLTNCSDHERLEACTVGVHTFDLDAGAGQPVSHLGRRCREFRNERA
jgi:hypothetical protein